VPFRTDPHDNFVSELATIRLENHQRKRNSQDIKQNTEEAASGDASAQYTLGLKYTNGEGVAKDKNEAVKWFRKAAEQGFALAQYNLGVAYTNGSGVSKDPVEAIKWYRRAAEQGHTAAKRKLLER